MTLESWFRFLRNRMDRNFDNVIVLDGDERIGKSTLAYWIARGVDPGFTLERLIYNHEDWNRIYEAEVKQATYLLDEGGNLLFSRDFNKRPNKRLVQILMTSGQNNNTLILCVPNFRWLDPYLREHRVQWRIHVIARGYAVAQARRKSWRNGTVWFEDEFKIGGPGEPGCGPMPLDVDGPYKEKKWLANLAQHGHQRDELDLNVQI